MSRFHSYVNTSAGILHSYNGEEPFAAFLKKFFSAHKKFGAKDRKFISQLCYCYFRPGKALGTLPTEERLLAGLFLCSNEQNEILAALKPAWNEKVKMGFGARQAVINSEIPASAAAFSIEDVFPWKDQLSSGVNHRDFCASFFIQPDLFLRLRPGHHKDARLKLETAGIQFENTKEDCVALPNSTKVDSVLEINKEAVIQDFSSQRTGELIQYFKQQSESSKPVTWDCCAASGGKSILAKDILGNIELYVSDIRDSIIANLKKRFAEAGITGYKASVLDLSVSEHNLPVPTFDLIICDAPCTGSGTWSRTPEQLYYFDEERAGAYASVQKKIGANVSRYIRPGGFLLYITCSVFKEENEDVVSFLETTCGLRTEKMNLYTGYDKKADTLFAALLRRPL